VPNGFSCVTVSSTSICSKYRPIARIEFPCAERTTSILSRRNPLDERIEKRPHAFLDRLEALAAHKHIPVADAVMQLMAEWRTRCKRIGPDDLVFSTWSGKSIWPNNVLRQQVYPTCAALGLPRASWLTLRRTYSSWAHEKGVAGKVIALLMGHAKVDTTLNVYTQVIDGALSAAVDRLGSELFTVAHKPEAGVELTH
jgi:integrase